MEKNSKENLTKQKFYHDVEKVFEQSTDQQKKTTEEMTKEITKGNEEIGNAILEGIGR